MSSAPAPTQASAGEPGCLSTSGARLGTIMSRSLFSLEDIVLYIVVAVRSYVVWILSSTYYRAMNVPGLSDVLRQVSSSPRIAAGPPAAPPSPAELSPSAPPRSSCNHRVSESRSAWSTRGCIVEGVLFTVVCGYWMRGLWPLDPLTLGKMFAGAIFRLPVQYIVHHAFPELRWLWSAQVVSVEHTNIDGERVVLLNSTNLDGIDPSEYDFFQKVYSFVVFTFALVTIPGDLGASISVVLISHLSLVFSVFQVAVVIVIYFSCWTICLTHLLYRPFIKTAIYGRFFQWELICMTQPRCRHVRAFLLAGGMIYAVLLHLSPAPSKWTWSLIVTHSTRLLSLLIALRGDNEGVANAAGEIVAHVPEAV
ncbi:expressed unknown protein [Ectocarpus siliculosus]|uniref:Transmembrane protein n=1 Tax=Ectocarpus siliculosus TaxID=2880 RepID=D7FLK8_ECTSI|nr:expressed unknown protein [Ectocarpus siliculosus]|eukprot:CBJ25824.1 expressed unknown protein [Ectocarpus siliculosus]